MRQWNPFIEMPSSRSGLPVVALLLIQVVVAYEWLNSAFTKIVRGGFASGLAGELARNSDGAPDWYRAVLSTAIIPHAAVFGDLIEAGELLVGAGMLATAVLLLVRGRGLDVSHLRIVLAVIAVTAVGGAFMNLNFSLYGGNPPVWSLGGDAFSEGVGVDNVLMLVQLVIAGVSASLFHSLRERRTAQALSRAA